MVESTQPANSEGHERKEGARTKAVTTGSAGGVGPQKLGGVHKFSKRPQFLKDRLAFFSELYEHQAKKLEEMPHDPIKVTLKDGKVVDGVSF